MIPADTATLFAAAKQHYQTGRFGDAETLYRQILDKDPHHGPSLFMMGLIAVEVRRFDVAEQLVRRALACTFDPVPLYHKALADILQQQGKLDDAIVSYKEAIRLKPDFIDALTNLGTTLTVLGKPDEAARNYEKVLSLKPDHALSLYNMAVITEKKGKTEKAREYYKKAIAANPMLAEAHNNLGNIYKEEKNLEKAKECYEQAIKSRENYPEAHYNLGIILENLKQADAAIQSFMRAGELRPYPDAYTNIGSLLQSKGLHAEAIPYYQKALAINPRHIEALNNIGSAYFETNEYEQAADYYRQVLELNPGHAKSLNNLATALKGFGQMDEAIECYRKAVDLMPGYARIHSNLLMGMVYTASITPEELFNEAVRFEKLNCAPLQRLDLPVQDINPERKIRIGYVSPDFRAHSVTYFFEPLLQNHDHENFEIFAYSNVAREDQITERLKKEFDHWRSIKNESDIDAAKIIQSDKIDILVDLAGHTGENRLLIFAHKPAPVQASWLGWPATTGMKAMDYRITDHYAEPEGMTENLNAEALWRLPGLFCCYKSQDTDPPVIDHPPFEDNGCITFGCFNNFSKVTDPVLATWSEIMARVPESRLLLEIAGLEGPKFRAELDERFRRFGFPMDRLILEPRKPENRLVFYNRIDIALDPFPCNGGTTSMDTLWMGAPFVTLEGRHFVSRMGVSILSNVGLPELIAKDTDEYIEKAVSLATDRDRLRAIRHNLRQRVEQSPMMDQKSFARNMEAAYRGMWRIYCASITAKTAKHG